MAQVKLPEMSAQGIYAGKYKDWSPDLRAVRNMQSSYRS